MAFDGPWPSVGRRAVRLYGRIGHRAIFLRAPPSIIEVSSVRLLMSYVLYTTVQTDQSVDER